VHSVATTGHLNRMRPINGSAVSSAKGVPPKPSSVVRNIPWYLPEVLRIDGTDFIAQVAQTCHHPVTYTVTVTLSPPNHKPNSLHHSRGHKLLLTCRHSLASLTSFGSSCQALLFVLKISPRVKDLFEHNL
jgi:hypothetical protein